MKVDNPLVAAISREFTLISVGYSFDHLQRLTPKGVRQRATIIGELMKTVKEIEEREAKR